MNSGPILENEYGTPRGVDEFVTWVETRLKSPKGRGTSDFRARKGLWKAFVEEAVPLAYFLKLKPPTKGSIIYLVDGYQSFDAIIESANSRAFIEVTTTESLSGAYARMHLNKYGFGPGETTSVRTRGDLRAWHRGLQPQHDGIPIRKSLLENDEKLRLRDRLKNKQTNSNYPENTSLLIYSDSTSLEDVSDADILTYLTTDGCGPRTGNTFSEVWVCIRGERLVQIPVR